MVATLIVNVPVRVLKNELSAYLRRVRRGERIVVTDRGKPVAEMGPIRAERLSSDQRMARLVEEGMVSPPQGKGLRSVRPVKVRGRSVAATLLEDRG
jgi:prevent-host-death family protein